MSSLAMEVWTVRLMFLTCSGGLCGEILGDRGRRRCRERAHVY